MAKGTRKGGGANKENNKTLTMNANNTDHSNTKAGSGASRNKSKDKQKIDLEEAATNSVSVAQFEETDDASAAAKKDHHKVQPTSTQIMLAQLIGGDPVDDLQKTKIQQVMDITGKPEDAVATALFDAGWDETRAIDLLLEDGDHLTAWEETGKKNRKKQKQSADDGKDENEDSEAFAMDPRDKSGKRGPPRLRRGGSAQGGDRSFTRNNRTGDMSNGEGLGSGRGRGDQPPRRGGRGGGGARGGDRSSYAGRGRRGGGGVGREGVSGNGVGGEAVGGFQGSIDTWNPNGSSGEAGSGSAGSTSGKSGQRSRGGHHGNSKDAFDNAGNWGDDFPAADDWDNEEYTGSLADTKVFTASGQGPQGKKGPQSSHPNKPGQQRPYPPQSQESQSANADSVPGGGPAAAGSVPAPSSAAVGAPTSSYSQPIDLSTLLHKPTTQSSIGNSQQTLLQFSQQATDSLKAAVGIGQQPSSSAASTKTGDQLYSSYASSAAGAGPNNNQTSYGQGNSAFTSIKSSQQSVAGGKQGAAAQNRSRMPPPSKIPNSAVEMPGDQLGRLDVQFGGLDLQFGGGGSSANSDSVNSFEFNGGPTSTSTTGNGPASSSADVDVSNSKYLPGDKNKVAQPATSSVDNFATKDKSGLSNTMNPNSKLGANDSFADSRKTGSGQNSASYATRGQAMEKPSSESMNSYHGGSSQNYNYSHSKPSYGQYGSNPNNYQQSSYGNSYSQNSYSTATTTSSNYSKSYSTDGKSGFQNDPGAVLGLTTSTNVLTGKISATTASNKVNVPNLPPGVASMLPQHYMGLPAAAFAYGLQQPTMYSAYSNAGLEDIAALQRATGLHTLQAGYYDPNGQYASTSLAAAAAGNRGDGNATSMNLNSLGSASTSSSSLSAAVTSNTNTMSGGASQQSNSNATAGGMGSGHDKSAFGNVSASDSTSSPIPSSSHQTMQNTATQQQPALNFAATNAFAQHQQTALPPGYAYFYPNLQAYGGVAGAYPPTMAVPTAAGGTGTSQFQKSGGYNYGTGGYDSLGQQGNKDFGGYSSSSGKGSSSNTAAGGAGKGGHQYWGNNLNSQLW